MPGARGYVTVPKVTCALSTPRISLGEAKLAVSGVAQGCSTGGWYTGDGYSGVLGGWVYRVPGEGYYPPSRVPQIGIARAQPVASPHRVPAGTPGPLARALRTPAAPAPVLEPIWPRFSSKYPKVSHILGVSP